MPHLARDPRPPLSRLSDQIRGRVIDPNDAEYDAARTIFYGGFDRKPAVVVRAADAADVARVVAHAAENGIELAVRSGGHSVAGHSVSEGGIVLDLSRLKGLDIDVPGRTAWAEAGLTAAEYTVAAGAHGLATGFGDTGSVGLGGLTLGGGVGYLVRKHGLTIDDLLAADLVTAEGSLVRADADSNPDLFWAIRGGGGNFGVATRFRYRLHEVGTIVGGFLVLPAAPEIVGAFVSAAEAAPEELSTIANVMTAPPLPFVPEELHGRPVLFGILVYAGPVASGERVVAPFRALGPPIADMVRPMPYPEIFMPEPEGYHPIAIGHTMLLEGLDARARERIVADLGDSSAQMAVTQIRVLGGAMARVPSDATAFAHRRARLLVNVAAVFERPEEAETHRAWVTGLGNVLSRGDRRAYTGFLGEEGEAGVRAAYPKPTWDRLAEVKARYDPTNLFRLNQNIPPASPGSLVTEYGESRREGR